MPKTAEECYHPDHVDYVKAVKDCFYQLRVRYKEGQLAEYEAARNRWRATRAGEAVEYKP